MSLATLEAHKLEPAAPSLEAGRRATSAGLPANNPALPIFTAMRLEVRDIIRDRKNREVTVESIQEMADSLKANGQLDPVIVRRTTKADEGGVALNLPPYVLIAGERRWRAHQLLKWKEIDARLVEGEDAKQARVMALVENLHRENLNAMQEARGYADLVEMGMTPEEIGKQVNRERSTIANAVRLVKLPEKIQEYIATEKLSAKHGVALLRFEGYPAVAEYIAREAGVNEDTADELRKGLPYAKQLVNLGLVRKISPAVLINLELLTNAEANKLQELPKFLAKEPWAIVQPGYADHVPAEMYALDPGAFDLWMGQQRKVFKDAHPAKPAAKGEGAKSKPKVTARVELNRVSRSDYRDLGDLPAELQKRIPEEKIETGNRYGDKMRFTRDVKLFDELKAEHDRKEKLMRVANADGMWAAIVDRLTKVKAVRGDEVVLLMQLAAWERPANAPEASAAAEALGLKLPKSFKLSDEDSWTVLAKTWQPLEVLRFAIAFFLRMSWRQGVQYGFSKNDDLPRFAGDFAKFVKVPAELVEKPKPAEAKAKAKAKKK